MFQKTYIDTNFISGLSPGSNITVQNNNNGTWTISSSAAGSGVAGVSGISYNGGSSLTGLVNIYATGYGLSIFQNGNNIYFSGTQTTEIMGACSDETSSLSVGSGKLTFRMPYNMWLTGVTASVNVAPTGHSIDADVNQGGVSILSSGIFIETGNLTSLDSPRFATILTNYLTGNQEIKIDLDQVGSTYAGAGYKITLLGYKI